MADRVSKSKHEDAADAGLRKLARTWAEEEGRALLYERDIRNRQGPAVLLPRADARIKAYVGAQRAKRRSRNAWIAVAACLAVYLALPQALIAARDAGGAGGGPASVTASVDMQAPAAGGSALAPMTNTQTEPIPIPFNVPERFSVVSASEDNGAFVYYVARDNGDDAVVTVDGTGGGAARIAGLPDTVMIDGAAVPAKVAADYKLLGFEKDGEVYTLSCRNDVGTLAALYRGIEGSQTG